MSHNRRHPIDYALVRRPERTISFALAWLCATVAGAQNATLSNISGANPNSGVDLQEVVVTATKTREQELVQVPMAIQAFTADQLQRKEIKEAADLIELIPGASQQSQVGAAFRIFSFRGSGAGGSVGDSMIGYYLDDTPFGVPNFQNAPPLRYFDLERVEVLRGPQGTLYGQGSMGGAIIYHTRNPDLTHFGFEGEAGTSKTADAADLNYTVSGAASIPLITDHLALRVSGGYDYRAGYADVYQGAPVGAPYKKDANDIGNTDARAVLLWRPDEHLSVRLQAWHFDLAQNYLQVMNSVAPPYASFQDHVAGYERANTHYYSSTIRYDFGPVQLTNATSYQDTSGGFDVGLNLGPPLGIGSLFNGYGANNFVNELRVNSASASAFHWVAGTFFQHARSPYAFNIDFPGLTIAGGTVTRTENESVFTELSYDLFGGKLVPLMGVRYFQDHRSSVSTSNGVPASSSSRPDVVTWRANLAYYPAEKWTVFINAGTGFRSGILQSQAQANAVIADGVPSSTALTPDKLRNIEGGVKAVLANGVLRFASSIYNIRYTNLQSAFNTSIGLAAFANLGDAETTGLDIDLTWRTPLEGLSASLIGNFNKAEFTNVSPAFASSNARTANGTRMYNTPPHNWRLDLNYDHLLGSTGLELFAAASASENGDARVQDPTVQAVHAYSLYSASVGVRKGAYQLTFYGDNLSDERGPTAANGPTLLAGPFPRTIGLRLRVSF